MHLLTQNFRVTQLSGTYRSFDPKNGSKWGWWKESNYYYCRSSYTVWHWKVFLDFIQMCSSKDTKTRDNMVQTEPQAGAFIPNPYPCKLIEKHNQRGTEGFTGFIGKALCAWRRQEKLHKQPENTARNQSQSHRWLDPETDFPEWSTGEKRFQLFSGFSSRIRDAVSSSETTLFLIKMKGMISKSQCCFIKSEQIF